MLSPTAATAAASASAELVPKHTYHAFMAKMQQPSASGLFRSIKLFVRDLLSDSQRSVDEVAEAVQAFFYETEEAIAQHPLWHGCEPEELDKACDALEKFVTTKLYDKVFLTDAEESESDRLLEERLQHLRFVTVEHLSVSPAFCTAYPWAGAQQELCKMVVRRGQTSWQRPGWPPPTAEGALPLAFCAAALWAPQPSCGGSGPAVPPQRRSREAARNRRSPTAFGHPGRVPHAARQARVRAELLQAHQLLPLRHECRLARRRRVLPRAHIRAATGARPCVCTA